jgi:DNA-binding response OmpR family regulator
MTQIRQDGTPAPLAFSRSGLTGKAPGAAGASGLILCVCENVPAVKSEVVPVLHAAGYETHLVEASLRRLPHLSGKPYRMVLFEVGTKIDTCYQICAQTRSLTDLPIMLVLRGAARNEILRGYQAGADAYVLVPFDPRELLARMSGLLRRE